MHERSLMDALLRQIEAAAQAAGGARVTCVRVRVGPMFHGSADHLREHFDEVARGTLADGATLMVRIDATGSTRYSQDVFVDSVDVEVTDDPPADDDRAARTNT